MSTVKTDAIETRAGGTSVLTIGTATQTIKLPGGTPGADKVLTSDATGEAAWAAAGGGKILQVIQVVKTDVFTTTSTTFVDVTGVTVSITPSAATSKILVLLHAYGGNVTTSNANSLTSLVRDSTEIFIGDAASNRRRSTTTMGPTRSATGYAFSMHISYLDSPSTTSATTYKLQACVGTTASGTFVLGRDGDDADQANEGRVPTSIIVMEVGA